MKTAELKGIALDWAALICEGARNLRRNPHQFDNLLIYDLDFDGVTHTDYLANYNPSTEWSEGGPIIEREKIEVRPFANYWIAVKNFPSEYGQGNACVSQQGKTPLEAAMRCYVASKLGDEVEIPEELQS